MPDLKLIYTEFQDYDIAFDDADLLITDDLETSVITSLFTHARRLIDDPDPVPDGDQGGWWADETLEPSGDFLGSKIWLTFRSKITPNLFLQIEQWGRECLNWMVEERVADDVTVIAQRNADTLNRVDIEVSVSKGGVDVIDFRYELNWEAQKGN